MNTIKTLLDQVKKAKGVESDYALAKALEIPKQRISEYYKGRNSPDEFVYLQIAKALNRPYESIQTAVRIEAEKDESRREVWREHLKRIGGIAAGWLAAIFFVVTSIVTPAPAQASDSNDLKSHALYYVKSLCSRYIRTAASFVLRTLSTCTPRFCFSG